MEPCFQMDFGSKVVFKWCEITGSTISFCKIFYVWKNKTIVLRR